MAQTMMSDREFMSVMRAVMTTGRSCVERGWTQHVAARDANGMEVNDIDDVAVEFCITGAVGLAAHQHYIDHRVGEWTLRVAALDRLKEAGAILPSESLHDWNDDSSRTKEQVLALFDKALAAIPEEPEEGE